MPASMKMGIISENPSSIISGSKSRKATPNNVPAAKLTRKKRNLFIIFCLKKIKIPSTDTKETNNTAIKICIKTCILFSIFIF